MGKACGASGFGTEARISNWSLSFSVGGAPGSVAEPVVIAKDRGPDDRVTGVGLLQLREFVVDLLVDDAVVLDPAHFPSVGFDLQKAAAMLDDLEPLAVDDLGDAVTDGGDAVTEVRAPSPDVDVLVRLMRDKPAATLKGQEPE